jgi:hypothetical protein
MPDITVKVTYFNGNHDCNDLSVTMNLRQPYGNEVKIPLSLFNRVIRLKYEWELVQKELKKAAGICPEEVPF